MTWRIGVDEAGYGPNLGPLTIAATVWRDDGIGRSEHRDEEDLYQRLGNAVAGDLRQGGLAIADSKVLYKPGNGLACLERGVLGALGGAPRSFARLLEATGADPRAVRRDLPWYSEFDCPLPVDADLEEVRAAADCLLAASRSANVHLQRIAARLVFPAELNDLVDRYGTKGAALSHATLGLVRDVVDLLPEARPLQITCDKHGGRNRYAGLLQHHFSEHWIETISEGRAESRYRWDNAEIRFRTGGEAELPAALASMTAKYLRELAMRGFNAFWGGRIPGLRPTAGYPVDAKRFKADIAVVQRQLAIDDRILWRSR